MMCDTEKYLYFNSDEYNAVLNEDISNDFENDLITLPNVLVFIKRLQDCINRHRNIILNISEKIKEQNVIVAEHVEKTLFDASTQTCDEDFAEEFPTASNENIVDQVKEIAESAVQQTGFVYEASSGMYYDYTTGYYYNAELGLYYDGNSGTYYKYDEESKTFNFHSSVAQELSAASTTNHSSQPVEELRTENVDEHSSDVKKSIVEKMEIEEGECSDSVESEQDEEEEEVDDERESDSKSELKVTICAPFKEISDDDKLDELANSWPPCMRVIVQETGLDELDVGTLFIVTCNGGTLGREGDHSITIPDITISKFHAKFKYSEEKKHYSVVDLGSRNGTYLNGSRLSVALQESPPHVIEHGGTLRVGSTNLLCHIHSGNDTCNDCEPGCLVKQHKGLSSEILNENKPTRHSTELRRLRRKYGLEGPGSATKVAANSANYADRADARRKTVGSSNDSEKTETASVYQPIKNNNKGFKMLAKMGWSEGQTLGKESSAESAITEPILVEQRPDKAGLGCTEIVIPVENARTKRKNMVWKKTQDRYKQLSKS